jgi:hypothetical protein
VTAALRPIASPFVAAAPTGARVRTRLRVSAQDETVLRAAGRHLGALAGQDLAAGARKDGWTRRAGPPPVPGGRRR